MAVGMSDYKELARELDIWIKDAENDELTPPIVLRKCKYAIEQLCTDVARLEAENRAKEQYIAETIGKVIKERDAAVDDLTFSYKHQLSCFTCKHNFGDSAADHCLSCRSYSEWEWRGVQEVEHGND